MSDAQKRSLRTLVQALIGALGAGLLNVLAGGLDPQVLAVIAVVLTTVFTATLNALEDSGRVPTVLK
jgi:hypothetical protein